MDYSAEAVNAEAVTPQLPGNDDHEKAAGTVKGGCFLHGMKIGSLELDNNLFLGPMAGFTDHAFRVTVRNCGKTSEIMRLPGLVCTEMVSAKAIVYNNTKTHELMRITPNERPAAIQLFGNDPGVMEEAVGRIEKLPFDVLDINMGCPVPKIVNNGEGSALMKDPGLIERIVRGARRSLTDRALTVKLRTGFDEGHLNVCECAMAAEAGGADAVAVHGRTREQYYTGDVDLGSIRRVKESLHIPVIGNGNVTDGVSALRMFSETGCDGVMIARQARGNPWIFREIAFFLRHLVTAEKLSPEEQRDVILEHIRLAVEDKGEYIAMRELRSQLPCYLKGIPGASRIRDRINTTEDIRELVKMIENVFDIT